MSLERIDGVASRHRRDVSSVRVLFEHLPDVQSLQEHCIVLSGVTVCEFLDEVLTLVRERLVGRCEFDTGSLPIS